MTSTPHESPTPSTGHERRSFFGRAAAIITGTIAVVFPFAAGSGVLLDPLRRRRESAAGADDEMAGYSRICPLDALPADGMPHEFVVTADITDAWSKTSGQRVGMVFLQREDADGKPNVTAFTAACPHLGCAVEFDVSADRYECPCHVSGFAKDGRKLFGPSLRDLDDLDMKVVEKNGTQEVWVAFRQFRAGVAERIPVG
jgi:menaquinol-cytochrome c reductase iron-sulfur subunit